MRRTFHLTRQDKLEIQKQLRAGLAFTNNVLYATWHKADDHARSGLFACRDIGLYDEPSLDHSLNLQKVIDWYPEEHGYRYRIILLSV